MSHSFHHLPNHESVFGLWKQMRTLSRTLLKSRQPNSDSRLTPLFTHAVGATKVFFRKGSPNDLKECPHLCADQAA